MNASPASLKAAALARARGISTLSPSDLERQDIAFYTVMTLASMKAMTLVTLNTSDTGIFEASESDNAMLIGAMRGREKGSRSMTREEFNNDTSFSKYIGMCMSLFLVTIHYSAQDTLPSVSRMALTQLGCLYSLKDFTLLSRSIRTYVYTTYSPPDPSRLYHLGKEMMARYVYPEAAASSLEIGINDFNLHKLFEDLCSIEWNGAESETLKGEIIDEGNNAIAIAMRLFKWAIGVRRRARITGIDPTWWLTGGFRIGVKKVVDGSADSVERKRAEGERAVE